MNETVIVMCPTLQRADYEWREYCKTHESIIRETKRKPLTVKLMNGQTLFFRGETEGSRAVRGYHASVVAIDDLLLEQGDKE